MSSQPATARRIGIALLAACSVLLTSCAAGRHAATANQNPPIDGTNGTVGALQLQAVAIAAPSTGQVSYAKGSDAALTMVLVNNGSGTDTLTGVSTSAAQNFAIFGSSAEASAAASPSASESASAKPSASATAHVGATSVDIGAGQSVSFGVGSSSKALLLLDLKDVLYPAQSVQVRFTFAKAGSVTLTVPVQTSTSPASSTVPAGTAAE